VLVADGVLEATVVAVGVRLGVTRAVKLIVEVGLGVSVRVGEAVTVYPGPSLLGKIPV
jgi:hypothetical protein